MTHILCIILFEQHKKSQISLGTIFNGTAENTPPNKISCNWLCGRSRVRTNQRAARDAGDVLTLDPIADQVTELSYRTIFYCDIFSEFILSPTQIFDNPDQSLPNQCSNHI